MKPPAFSQLFFNPKPSVLSQKSQVLTEICGNDAPQIKEGAVKCLGIMNNYLADNNPKVFWGHQDCTRDVLQNALDLSSSRECTQTLETMHKKYNCHVAHEYANHDLGYLSKADRSPDDLKWAKVHVEQGIVRTRPSSMSRDKNTPT